MEAKLRSTGLDARGLQRLACLLRDVFASWRTHGGENIDDVLASIALHLDEVDDVLHVLKELVTLLMLVGLVHGIRKEARGARDGGN